MKYLDMEHIENLTSNYGTFPKSDLLLRLFKHFSMKLFIVVQCKDH